MYAYQNSVESVKMSTNITESFNMANEVSQSRCQHSPDVHRGMVESKRQIWQVSQVVKQRCQDIKIETNLEKNQFRKGEFGKIMNSEKGEYANTEGTEC